MKIEIYNSTGIGNGTKVEIDGRDIPNIISAKLNLEVNEINHLQLNIAITQDMIITIEGETFIYIGGVKYKLLSQENS